MGILTRFKDIMTANVNALLDKCEDPEKMIDQYLRNLENDMAKVKAETASIIAEEKSAKRKLDECTADMEKMTDYAKKAVAAGNDADAKQFLAKRTELVEKSTILEQQYTLASENAIKMREMHDKLASDIASLKSKRDMLKAKVKVAETKQRMNKMGSSAADAGNNLAAFDRMEDKVNRMLDEADAMATLDKSSNEVSIDNLASKYDTKSSTSEVDDELARLKAEMGM